MILTALALAVKWALGHAAAAAHGALVGHATAAGPAAIAAKAVGMAPQGAAIVAKALTAAVAQGPPISALTVGTHAALASVGHVTAIHAGSLSTAQTAADALSALGLIAVAERLLQTGVNTAEVRRRLAAGDAEGAKRALGNALRNARPAVKLSLPQHLLG